jgi:CUE domain
LLNAARAENDQQLLSDAYPTIYKAPRIEAHFCGGFRLFKSLAAVPLLSAFQVYSFGHRAAGSEHRHHNHNPTKMVEEEPSINIPSLLTLAVVSFLVIRWFLNRDGSNAASGSGPSRGRMIDPAQVEQISQMFPQLNRRDIMWDLQRNGGSVAATTERILTGRGLDTVSLFYPVSFFFCPRLTESRHGALRT